MQTKAKHWLSWKVDVFKRSPFLFYRANVVWDGIIRFNVVYSGDNNSVAARWKQDIAFNDPKIVERLRLEIHKSVLSGELKGSFPLFINQIPIEF